MLQKTTNRTKHNRNNTISRGLDCLCCSFFVRPCNTTMSTSSRCHGTLWSQKVRRENRVEGNICKPFKKNPKALRGGDHRLKLQQCAAVMEVITRPCEPHITPTLLHLEPRAGQRKPRAPFKGVRGGSAKGHAERSDAISVSSRASHTSSVWFPEWERVLLKLIAFPGFLAIGTFFLTGRGCGRPKM